MTLKTLSALVAIIISPVAFLLTLLGKFGKLKIEIIPDDRIQLAIGENGCAFNIFKTIIGKGPKEKLESIKFTGAHLTVPDGRVIYFSCNAHLEEGPFRRGNKSGNLPITIKGGEDHQIITAYGTTSISRYKPGKYLVSLMAYHFNNKEEITTREIEFFLTEKDIELFSDNTAVRVAIIKK